MERIDILGFSADELSIEKLEELISSKKSFRIFSVKDISFIVNKIEKSIEKKGLSCRVYSEMRSAAIAGIAIPTGITQLGGLAVAAGTAIHNLAPFNPDYEIGKNYVKSTVTVTYKRD